MDDIVKHVGAALDAAFEAEERRYLLAIEELSEQPYSSEVNSARMGLKLRIRIVREMRMNIVKNLVDEAKKGRYL